jgi:hypothetical protein
MGSGWQGLRDKESYVRHAKDTVHGIEQRQASRLGAIRGALATRPATATGHDVYVADAGNNRLDKFDPAGTFIRALIGGLRTGVPA